MPARIKILIKDQHIRSIALVTPSHALIFSYTTSSASAATSRNASVTSLAVLSAANEYDGPPRCIAEFAALKTLNLEDYRPLGTRDVFGTLGLITVDGEVFLCVVTNATRAAEVRPGETVQKINSVEFHCLSSSKYDHILNDTVNPWPTEEVDEEGFDMGNPKFEGQLEHPCLALKKLLSSGTFFYSADFDLTRRLQKRITDDSPSIAVDSLDAGFLWNSYMIQPLVDFRSRLSPQDRGELDTSRILTSAIRGFCSTLTVPYSSAPLNSEKFREASSLSVISRLSCRRAGTRFNSRGIDDDGNVANFVETETIFWSPSGVCFSYVQVRGSVPLFWEQATGLVPGQQKISVTRSAEATQPAFDKHFEHLEHSYGAVHVVNLLSAEKPAEADLSHKYRMHMDQCPLSGDSHGTKSQLLQATEYDFHAETRGPNGYDSANMIKYYIRDSAQGFGYFISEERDDLRVATSVPILQQEGVFRTNCLDCLDRTNLIQTILSQLALETLLAQRRERGTPDFWGRHRTLWADNGDVLSKIYAGTGALKSSFTRSGKMSLGGFLSDARKSAARMYINNFADKGRQNTIDMLLGRLVNQHAVMLFDPINDYVQDELKKQAAEYTTSKEIHILVGTFNLNGKDRGIKEDLSLWLCPGVDESQRSPEIVAIGFQEIVELSPQQIMSTDPARRQAWEAAVKATLNGHAEANKEEEYVLLRGGQLVGASLSVFVRASILPYIKNVEGSIKKTGLSGMAGNKGAVAIRIEYAKTSICFVTAHLAAGHSNHEERNRDYQTISEGLRFQRNRAIDDHDTVIWFGDFNYRIALSNERARQLIEDGDLDSLYSNDQLQAQMKGGSVFASYTESHITFPPTYKFDAGKDTYDTSEKSRIPAWTDRVLRKGNNIQQINYNIAPLRFSDHRPVYATFNCEISVVDEKHRDGLRRSLYAQRKGSIVDSSLGTLAALKSTDGYAQLGLPVRKLPPASDEGDWVKIENAPAPPPPRRSKATQNPQAPPRQTIKAQTDIPLAERPRLPPPRAMSSSPRPRDVRARALPSSPPNTRAVLPPPSQANQIYSPAVRKILPPPLMTSHIDNPISLTSTLSPVSKKPPPPRPQKPAALSSAPTKAEPAPPHLAPRRSRADDFRISARKPVMIAPGISNILDNQDDEMDGLKDWEVLRPG